MPREKREAIKLEEVGLIGPRIEWPQEEPDWDDVDPSTAWEEWERWQGGTMSSDAV